MLAILYYERICENLQVDRESYDQIDLHSFLKYLRSKKRFKHNRPTVLVFNKRYW